MFSFGERLGIFFTVQGACFSAVAVTPILLLAAFKWLRRTARTWGGSSGIPDPIDNIIFLNLMLADLIRAVGDLLMVKWMLDGVVTEGRLCTFQAVLRQVGNTSMAMMSLVHAIAMHTFCVLILRWRGPEYISKVVVLMIWGFTALVIAIPYCFHRNEKYYGDAGFWCFIGPEFKTERYITGSLWLWAAAPLMTILYFTMFVVMRGWFIIDNGVYWYKTHMQRYGTIEPMEETQDEKYSKAIANLMLYYPAVYIICLLPNSVAHWISFNGSEVPYQFTFFGSTLFAFLIGTSDSPELPLAPATNIQSKISGDVELPFTRSPTTSDYIPPNIEGGRSSQFQTYNQILRPEGAGTTNNKQTSPRGRGKTDLDEDEEGYGYLPNR